MPITKSAKKALRVADRKKLVNDQKKKSMKEAIKKVEKLVSEKKTEEARKVLPQAYKAIDKAAKGKVIEKNTASRKKSKVARLVK